LLAAERIKVFRKFRKEHMDHSFQKLTFGFFSLDLLGKISEKIDWMRNISIFSLYQPGEIVNGKDMVASSIILSIIGYISFGLAIVLFRKRDLPL
jgi:ABC-2 type transport system permease protein